VFPVTVACAWVAAGAGSVRKTGRQDRAADSDEVARAFRDDAARCFDMMSPGVRCLLAGGFSRNRSLSRNRAWRASPLRAAQIRHEFRGACRSGDAIGVAPVSFAGRRRSRTPRGSRNAPWSAACRFRVRSAGTLIHIASWVVVSRTPRPIPDRPLETPRPGPREPRTPYPVNDPGFADPNNPGSEPHYIPVPSPAVRQTSRNLRVVQSLNLNEREKSC
jgi:hypothetical protein